MADQLPEWLQKRFKTPREEGRFQFAVVFFLIVVVLVVYFS